MQQLTLQIKAKLEQPKSEAVVAAG